MSCLKKSIILFLFLFNWILAVSQNNHFFDYKNGLSNSLINDVIQDHFGFIWVATEDGLNRFDGIKFKTFTEESHGLKANYVTTLLEDSENNIWIGFVNGLQKYDPIKETFTSFNIYIADNIITPFVTGIIEAENGDIWIATSGNGLVHVPKETGRSRYSTRLNNKFSSLLLRAIYEDSEGILWIGFDDKGINTYNPETGEIRSIENSAFGDNSLPANSITSIKGDSVGNIFIASLKEGLCKYNKYSGSVTKIFSPSHNKYQIPVKGLMRDSKNQLWVGTDGLGLYIYNEATEEIIEHPPSNSPFDFSKSKVHCIVEDKDHNIWAGIFQKGLFLFPKAHSLFNHYGYRAFDQNSIGSSCVTSIDGDSNEIWIGTDGDGIYNVNRKSGNINHYDLAGLTQDDANNTVFSLCNSETDILWVGTYTNGLLRFNKKTGRITSFKNNPNDKNSIPTDNIGCIEETGNGCLWIGTYGEGLLHFNVNTNTFTKGISANDSLNSLIPKLINSVFMDKEKNIWLATYQGLVYANLKKNSLEIFTKSNTVLPSNIIYSLEPDYQGNLWIGTYKGLVKIAPGNMSLTTYSTKDGMGGNVICAILEDKHKQLWISTHSGLSRFNPENETFVNYFSSDGLQSNEFYRNSAFKSKDNQIYFGGINGVTEINENYLQFASKKPEVILTNFQKFGVPVDIRETSGKRIVLSKSIVAADTIHLLEKDNVFSIEFSSNEISNQSQIEFEYMMEGFDQHWNKNSVNNRLATYTNLPHGKYIFKVRGLNKSLVSEPRELMIIIHPPWYKTMAAKILWVFILSMIPLGGIQLYKQTFRRIEAEKMNEKKMQFFINISHEIRTPLSLIIDPIEKLIVESDDTRSKKLLGIMQQNANRIFRLINQLMDVRKLDKGKMLVKFQETNLNSFVKVIAESYNYQASVKNISFKLQAESKEIMVWLDPLNFEKVIINLLSNAFKFTGKDGEISIKIAKTKAYAIVIVTDTGIGIKKTETEKIFNRFYQVNSDETRNITGTGIGLHLSRSLVELHGGKLYAEPGNNGIGSKFIIQIPLGNNHLPKEDLITSENRLPAPSHSVIVTSHCNEVPKDNSKPKNSSKIMIVEDESEIRNYLVEELRYSYQATAYENGKQAYAKVLDEMPDLIISDIMMPEMDGITFCKKIKNHIETNHIPIILLTALSKEEDRAEGIETGADMYLVKPFKTSFLLKSITNLLENRKRILTRFEKKIEHEEIEPIELPSHDEMLMQKVMTIIRDNISNSDLNVEMLADGVGISRVHMHRKLKEITNQSARDLIRNVRMKQAAYILINKKINVSEVAYSLGYSSLSHFSTSFKSYYGISPTEYTEQKGHCS